MKKGTKIALIAAAILVAAGLLIGAFGMYSLHGDWSRLNREETVTKTVAVSEPFSNISIEADEDNVRLVPSEDGACKVVYQDTENVTHTVAVENGTLTIREVDNSTWIDHIGFSWGERTIVVYLPEPALLSLSAVSDTGDIEIPETFAFEEAELSSDTGDIDFSAAVEKDLTIDTDTGDVYVSGVAPENAVIETDTGDVTVDSMNALGALQIMSNTGDIKVTGTQCRELHVESDTGEFWLEDTAALGNIHLKSNTGDITLRACDADTLSIQSDTGDVVGTLGSDKVFLVQSDTGEISVPKTTAGGACEITTNTGDILIEIEK